MGMDIFMAQNVTNLLKNAGSAFQTWGKVIVFVIGTIMVIAAVFFIAKGLMSQGRGQTNWALTIILLILGGVFMATGAGGWSVLKNVTGTTTNTLNEWADNNPGGNWEEGE